MRQNGYYEVEFGDVHNDYQNAPTHKEPMSKLQALQLIQKGAASGTRYGLHQKRHILYHHDGEWYLTHYKDLRPLGKNDSSICDS